jgi:hypothetical protein
LFGQTSFFIKKHSAMPPPPPRGLQNTKYLLALISSSFFFCVTVCENKKNEGNHILLMMSFSMTQQDIWTIYINGELDGIAWVYRFSTCCVSWEKPIGERGLDSSLPPLTSQP